MIITWNIKSKNHKDFNIDGVSYEKIITHVHWECLASNDTITITHSHVTPFNILQETYTTGTGRNLTINPDFDPSNYTNYDDITDEIMISWVKDWLGTEEVNKIETLVTNRFNQA